MSITSQSNNFELSNIKANADNLAGLPDAGDEDI
jgi:hypothetical protein